MELSVREAAVMLGTSQRTVRARMARGELPAVKRGGRWKIDRRRLPLTEDQHRALQKKADSVRQVVDAALPSRLATQAGQRQRSLADLEAFRLGAELLGELRAAPEAVLAPVLRQRLVRRLEAALLALSEAAAQFHAPLKVAAVNRCRTLLAQCLALLMLELGLEPPAQVRHWVTFLETQLLPAVSGYSRWVDGLGRGRRS